MAVTLYVYDRKKRIRRILTHGITELVHQEEKRRLLAEIPPDVRAMPGEYLGFACVDGKFRLFAIDAREEDTRRGVDSLTATDEAAAELADTVTQALKLTGVHAPAAVEAAIAGTGWQIGTRTDGEKADFQQEADSTLNMLEEIEAACDVRILPRFEFTQGRITGRIIDIEEKRPVYRGRLFEGETDAGRIVITQEGRPKTCAYGYGAVTGSDDPPGCLSIADAVWSRAAGDPVDKPAGQLWVGDPEAIEKSGMRCMIFRDEGETDAGALLKKTWEALKERMQPEAGGTASLSDLESVQPHKKVRLYDEVAVKAVSGENFRAAVLEIARDYIRPNRTKITIGREKKGQKRRARSLVERISRIERTQGRHGRSGSAGRNRIIENEALIQLNAEAIQLNAATILAQAEQIALKASHEEVTEQGKRLTQAEIDIDGANAAILLKASQETVDAQGERLSSAEIRIDGAESQIALKADKIELDGLVTYSEMQGEINKVKITDASYVTTAALSTQSLDANFVDTNTLSVADQQGWWKEQTVVTGIKLLDRSAKTADGKGTVNFKSVDTVYDKKIYYFGY